MDQLDSGWFHLLVSEENMETETENEGTPVSYTHLEAAYRVTAVFLVPDADGKLVEMKAELARRIKDVYKRQSSHSSLNC